MLLDSLGDILDNSIDRGCLSEDKCFTLLTIWEGGSHQVLRGYLLLLSPPINGYLTTSGDIFGGCDWG